MLSNPKAVLPPSAQLRLLAADRAAFGLVR
jgi:hypothetical protein